LSNKTRKIIEQLEAKEARKETGSASEEEKPTFRKPYQPEELTFTPKINERSKQVKRGADIVTQLVTDAEIRTARKEKAIAKRAAEEARKSRMEQVKPCSKDSRLLNYAAFEQDL
jgi:hypothetical protein